MGRLGPWQQLRKHKTIRRNEYDWPALCFIAADTKSVHMLEQVKCMANKAGAQHDVWALRAVNSALLITNS